MANNKDYFSNLFQQLHINTGVVNNLETAGNRAAFLKSVNLDLANWGYQFQTFIYPIFNGPENYEFEKYTGFTSGAVCPWDVLDYGACGYTLFVQPDATPYGPECLFTWLGSEDSLKYRPTTIYEAIVCLHTLIEDVESEFEQYDDAWIREWMACSEANIERVVADSFGCDYPLDCDPDPVNKYSTNRHIYEIFNQIIDGGPDLGLDFSCEDTYPALSLNINCTDINWDCCLEVTQICFLEDYLNAIKDFTGMDAWDDGSPVYSSYGSLCHLVDGMSLEESLWILDQALCDVCSDVISVINTAASGGTHTGDSTWTASGCDGSIDFLAGTGIGIDQVSNQITISNIGISADTLQEAYDGGASSTGGKISLDSTYHYPQIIVDQPNFPEIVYPYQFAASAAGHANMTRNIGTADHQPIGNIALASEMIFSVGIKEGAKFTGGSPPGPASPFTYNVVNCWQQPLVMHVVSDNFYPFTNGKPLNGNPHEWGTAYEWAQEGTIWIAQGNVFEDYGDTGANTNFPWGAGNPVLDACGVPLQAGALYYREPGNGNIWRLNHCPGDQNQNSGCISLYSAYHCDQDASGVIDGGSIVLKAYAGDGFLYEGIYPQTPGVTIWNGDPLKQEHLESLGPLWNPCDPNDPDAYYSPLFLVKDRLGVQGYGFSRLSVSTRDNGICPQWIVDPNASSPGQQNGTTPNNPDTIPTVHLHESILYLKQQDGNIDPPSTYNGVQPDTGACEGAIWIDGGAAGVPGRLVYRMPGCGEIFDLTASGVPGSQNLWHNIDINVNPLNPGTIDRIPADGNSEVYQPGTTSSVLNFRSLKGIAFHVLSGGAVSADTLGIGLTPKITAVDDNPFFDITTIPADNSTVAYDPNHQNSDGTQGAYVEEYHWNGYNTGNGQGIFTQLSPNATHLMEFKSLTSSQNTIQLTDNGTEIDFDVTINLQKLIGFQNANLQNDGDTIAWDSQLNEAIIVPNYGKQVQNIGVAAANIVKQDINGTAELRGLKSPLGSVGITVSNSGDELELEMAQIELCQNVDVNNLQAGDGLRYDAGQQKWVNQPIAGNNPNSVGPAGTIQFSDGAGGFDGTPPELYWDSQKPSLHVDGYVEIGPGISGLQPPSGSLMQFLANDCGTILNNIVQFTSIDTTGIEPPQQVANISLGNWQPPGAPQAMSMLLINGNEDPGTPSEIFGGTTALGVGIIGGQGLPDGGKMGGLVFIAGGDGAWSDLNSQPPSNGGATVIQGGLGGFGDALNAGANGGDIVLRTGAGGDSPIQAGLPCGDAGQLQLRTSDGGQPSGLIYRGNGGDINIESGNGIMAGKINIRAGITNLDDQNNTPAESISIHASDSYYVDAGDVHISAGNLLSGAPNQPVPGLRAGDIFLQAGSPDPGTGNAQGGDVHIMSGTPQPNEGGDAGSIQLRGSPGSAGVLEFREVLCRIPSVTFGAGDYFEWQSPAPINGPPVVTNFVVWYSIGGQGVGPGGNVQEIEVQLVGNETAAQVATATENALNAFQQNLNISLWVLSSVAGDDGNNKLNINDEFVPEPGASLVDIADGALSTGFVFTTTVQSVPFGNSGNIIMEATPIHMWGVGGPGNDTYLDLQGSQNISGDLFIAGKLTVLGAIDPTMLYLTETPGAPGGPGTGPNEGVIFVDQTDHELYFQPHNNGPIVQLSSSVSSSAGPQYSVQFADAGNVAGGNAGFTYDPNSQFVGIGVTAPNGLAALPLQVEGGSQIDCATSTGTLMVGPEDGDNLVIGDSTIPDTMAIQAKVGADTAARLDLNPCGGLVTVGSPNPASGALSVEGAISLTDMVLAWDGVNAHFVASQTGISSVPVTLPMNSQQNGGSPVGGSFIEAQTGAAADDSVNNGGNGGELSLKAGAGGGAVDTNAGNGGDVTIRSGDGGPGIPSQGFGTPGNAGDILVAAGDGGVDAGGQVNGGTPGDLTLTAGDGVLDGGNVHIVSGNATGLGSFTGGMISITTGVGGNDDGIFRVTAGGSPTSYYANPGGGSTRGGDIEFRPGGGSVANMTRAGNGWFVGGEFDGQTGCGEINIFGGDNLGSVAGRVGGDVNVKGGDLTGGAGTGTGGNVLIDGGDKDAGVPASDHGAVLIASQFGTVGIGGLTSSTEHMLKVHEGAYIARNTSGDPSLLVESGTLPSEDAITVLGNDTWDQIVSRNIVHFDDSADTSIGSLHYGTPGNAPTFGLFAHADIVNPGNTGVNIGILTEPPADDVDMASGAVGIATGSGSSSTTIATGHSSGGVMISTGKGGDNTGGGNAGMQGDITIGATMQTQRGGDADGVGNTSGDGGGITLSCGKFGDVTNGASPGKPGLLRYSCFDQQGVSHFMEFAVEGTAQDPNDVFVFGEGLNVGGIRIKNVNVAAGDGTMRYTGNDFEGRHGGAWVSLTGGGGGGGAQDLAATLQIGNVTGANDLIVDDAQFLGFSTGGSVNTITIGDDGTGQNVKLSSAGQAASFEVEENLNWSWGPRAAGSGAWSQQYNSSTNALTLSGGTNASVNDPTSSSFIVVTGTTVNDGIISATDSGSIQIVTGATDTSAAVVGGQSGHIAIATGDVTHGLGGTAGTSGGILIKTGENTQTSTDRGEVIVDSLGLVPPVRVMGNSRPTVPAVYTITIPSFQCNDGVNISSTVTWQPHDDVLVVDYTITQIGPNNALNSHPSYLTLETKKNGNAQLPVFKGPSGQIGQGIDLTVSNEGHIIRPNSMVGHPSTHQAYGVFPANRNINGLANDNIDFEIIAGPTQGSQIGTVSAFEITIHCAILVQTGLP